MLQNRFFFGMCLFFLSFFNYAAVDITDNFSVSGFGSSSIAKTNTATPLFVNREITEDVCFDCDTTFGLQLDYVLSDVFSASLQMVKRPQDHWSDPELEWLYLNYRISDMEVKLGRLRLPLFLASEYYYVSQAYVWSRPPQEVYASSLGVTAFDGVSLAWDYVISDEVLLTVSPYYGGHKKSHVEIGERDINIKNNYTAGVYFDITGFNYRIHSNVMKVNFDQTIAMNGHTYTSQQNNELWLYSLGGEYALNAWQMMAEVQTNEAQTSWYASLAYGFEKLTPYLVYAESYKRLENNSITAGVRYELTSTISLNTEWQIMKLTGDAVFNTGQFTKYDGSDESQIITLMVNFIF